MKVEWFRCKGGMWCDLFKLDLTHEYFQDTEGVFIVWTGEENSRKVLVVGSGMVADELQKIKQELAVQAFQHLGVSVGWAEAPVKKHNGITLFLSKQLDPAIQSSIPKASTVKVNMPWDD